MPTTGARTPASKRRLGAVDAALRPSRTHSLSERGKGLWITRSCVCVRRLFSALFHSHAHTVETLCRNLGTATDGKAIDKMHDPTRRSLTTGWRLNLSSWQVRGKNSMREDGCNSPSGCKVVKTSRTGSPAGSWFGFGLASKGWMMRGRGRITRSWRRGSAVALERDPGGARTPRRDRAPAFGRRQRTRTGNKPLETHGNCGNVEPANVRRGENRQRSTTRVRENP